MTGDGLLL